MLKIGFGGSDVAVSKAMQDLHRKQMPYIIAVTATRLGGRVKAGELTVMKQRLDRPTPTTLNSLFLKPATKGKPEARVYFKDQWASGIPADAYLQQVVGGGQRKHKRFEKALIARGLMKSGQFALPNSDLLNQYGNVSRGTMSKILSGLGAAETASGYQANASGSKRSKAKGNARRFFAGMVDSEDGVWERKGTAFGEGVRPVFLFSNGAPQYRTIFPFHTIGQNIVAANYAYEFGQAFDRAVATAKP